MTEQDPLLPTLAFLFLAISALFLALYWDRVKVRIAERQEERKARVWHERARMDRYSEQLEDEKTEDQASVQELPRHKELPRSRRAA